MEIGDWSVALEYDIESAAHVQKELRDREIEREERDRDFWITMFGGEPSGGQSGAMPEVILTSNEDEVIMRSPLGQR